VLERKQERRAVFVVDRSPPRAYTISNIRNEKDVEGD
jgi:hypothetical protein